MAKHKGRRSATGDKPWLSFELAVNDFLQLILKDDPNATVTHNPPKVDRDTHQKQQVDVWVKYLIGGHIPVKLLVSCKDHGRKLDVGDIRTFIQEIEDAGASTGAIYSRSGFSKGALKKAAARGIGCFQLWKDRRADKPVIELYRRYWCWDSIALPIVEVGDAGLPVQTWDELFDLRMNPESEQSVGEYVEEELRKLKDEAVKQREFTRLAFPENAGILIDLEDSPTRSTKVTFQLIWKCYQGKISAAVLNGSFCVTSGKFVGTERSEWPVVYPPPASDWEEVYGNPPRPQGIKDILFTKNSNGLVAELKRHFGGLSIR